MLRDRLSDDDARHRMGAQHEDEFYTKRSKYVLVNDTTPDDLHIKVLELADVLLKEAR
jgi:dephospho-CoA kinase